MPRTKVVMKFIQDVKKRESTYKNRLRSLVQKIWQLAALCGVDILFIAVKPGTAGARGEAGITTWPADRGALKELTTRFRETHQERIKENLTTSTYLQGELAKEQRKLVKVKQCRLDDVLTLWDRHLDDLPAEDLIALHHAMGEILERARRLIAELGSVDVVVTSTVAVSAPARQHAPAFPGNDWDLNLSDAGSSMGSHDHSYYLQPDILPQPVPVQSSYIGFQFHMHPPCISFGGTPMPFMPFQMVAPSALAPPPGFSFSGGGINTMDPLPASTTGFYDDFAMQGSGQGFAAGEAAAYHQEFLTYSFDAAGTGAGYDLEPRAAGVWPLGTPSYPVDSAAYQLQNGTVMWSDNGMDQHALGEQEEQGPLLHRRM